MKEKSVLVYARTEEEIQDFVNFLKRHYQSVICTGVNHNTREPFKGGYRGYITVTGDLKEVTSDE